MLKNLRFDRSKPQNISTIGTGEIGSGKINNYPFQPFRSPAFLMVKLKLTTMRRLHLIIVLFLLLGATLVTLGLRSLSRDEFQTETAGPEIDRPVMLCI